MSAVRALSQAKAFDYAEIPTLENANPIEITHSVPELAQAISGAIEARGGQARIVSQASGKCVCILTEGLSGGTPAFRHHAVLSALMPNATNGQPVYVLDYAAASTRADLGGCAGLCRSVRIEQPDAPVYALSLVESTSPDELARQIVSTLSAPPEDYILRADGGWHDVLGSRLAPVAGTKPQLSASVWLVTGGARGVTADCARELARRTQGSFLLLGRSGLEKWPDWLPQQTDLKELRGLLARNSAQPGMPKKPVEIDRFARKLLASAEITKTLQAIEATGGKARYLQADIANRNDVRRSLAQAQQTTGPITGLVHGAGVLSDGLAGALQAKDFEKVFAPKVGGLENVLACLDIAALNHIAMFSSASAVFGNSGQANYAAANGWLNTVAETLSGTLPDTQVKSFCWGPWQGGMVDETLARMFSERGISLISPPEGARIFADMLLGSPRDQVRFVIGDDWSGA